MHDPVAIIGGGITGVGLARDLAMRGVDTIVLERNRLGGETSLHTHGVLHSGARYAVADPDAAQQCIQENRVLHQIAPHTINETGGYFLSLRHDSKDYYRNKVEACSDCGILVQEHDPQELQDRVPHLTDQVEAGFSVPDSVFHPQQLLGATAQSAQDHGATFKCNTTVSDIDVEDGKAISVTIQDETIPVSHIANCAGPWAGHVAGFAGLNVHVRPVKGAMTVIKNPGIDTVLNRCRSTDDGDIILPRGDQAVIGTTSIEIDDPDRIPETSTEEHQMIEQGACMVPAIDSASVIGTYWGARPLYSSGEDSRAMSRDWFLLDHRDDGVDGMTTVLGGKFTTHRLMAEQTADHICQRLDVDEPCRTADEELPSTMPDSLLAQPSWPPVGN